MLAAFIKCRANKVLILVFNVLYKQYYVCYPSCTSGHILCICKLPDIFSFFNRLYELKVFIFFFFVFLHCVFLYIFFKFSFMLNKIWRLIFSHYIFIRQSWSIYHGTNNGQVMETYIYKNHIFFNDLKQCL